MIKKVVLILVLILVLATGNVFAQGKEETLEAKVIGINKESLTLQVIKGSLQGEEIEVATNQTRIAGSREYKLGDHLLIGFTQTEGQRNFYIIDYIRRRPLLIAFFGFIVLVLAIGRWQGISSLIGMGVTYLVIFQLILPVILSGTSPILAATAGAFLIIPITFYLSHGLNRKTTVAVVSTVIALVITSLLAVYFVDAAWLTGFASEEAGYLQTVNLAQLNMKGLLLAGIIIGALGVLDDITIAQAAVVKQLAEANKDLKFKDLFFRAMKVGRDHIASMVNTLILVYTGSALPLLLIFINNPHPVWEIINYEIIAEEIIRTLVGSIGLILAVPITTLFAVWLIKRK
jgi:uncharacterized membrane protein